MGVTERRSPFLFQWREAFSSDKGPPPSTRLLLWCIAKHMDSDGTGAFPGQELLARESGLCIRTVKTKLKEAEQLGWLGRTPRNRRGVASFRYGTDYVPLIPARALGGAAVAPKSSTRDSADHATIGADHARSVQQLHPSTSENSTENALAYKNRGYDPPANDAQQCGDSLEEWIQDYEKVQHLQERAGRVIVR